MRVPALLLLLGACASAPSSLRPRPAPAADLVREADRLRRRGDRDEAARLYAKAQATDPEASTRAGAGLQLLGSEEGRDLELRRRYREGRDRYLAGRLEPAGARQREAFTAAAEPWRSLGLGSSWLEEGDIHRAGRYYERAVALDPAFTWARLGLARVQLARGRLGDAEAEFRAAMWTEPEHPAPYLGLSILADRRGRLAEAFAWARESFRRAPAQESLVRRLHNLAVRGGREYQRVAAHLLEQQGGGVALLLAGDLLRRRGEDARAEALFRRAVQSGDVTQAEVARQDRPPVANRLRTFVRAFTRSMRARYRHYAATRETLRFDELVAWARDLYERTTEDDLGPAGEPRDFTFVGKLVDPTLETDEPLVRVLAQNDLLLVLGERNGGPPEAMLASVMRREARRRVRVRGVEVEREAVWTGRRHLSGYLEWSGGGDLAGLALEDLILIDLDALAGWEGDVLRRLRPLRGHKDALFREAALPDQPVTAVNDPAGVAERLYLAGPVDFAEEVRVHEEAHLVDAARYLPVEKHPLRSLGLAVRRGFSAGEIQAFLERNAQLTAIAEGPHPLAALAACCATLGRPGVHANGYREIVEAFVVEIRRHPERFPEIDTDRVILQQLHRLPANKVRALARDTQRRWE